MLTDISRVVAVAMLYHPPFDKVAAKVLAQLKKCPGTKFPVAAYVNSKTCNSRTMQEWEDRGVLPIDIGEDKYHNKAGSATDLIAKRFGFQLSPAEKELVRLVNENNSEGSLKRSHQPIPWTMRELFELDEQMVENVVNRVEDAINAYLDAFELWNENTVSDLEGLLSSRFPDLFNATMGTTKPFTAGRLMHDLFLLGRSDDEVREAVSFWVDEWAKLQKKMKEAKEAFGAGRIKHETWDNPRLRLFVLGVITDDRFVSKAMAKKCDVLVVRNPNGNTAIIGHGLDFTNLANELLRLEPDRWHFTGRGSVLNGSPMYTDTRRSRFSIRELVHLLWKFPPSRMRKKVEAA